MCRFNRRFHLLERERLGRVHVIEAAHRPEHLDHVRAGGDLLADGHHHPRHAVGLPSRGDEDLAGPGCAAGRVQAVARPEDARPLHRPAVDQIAHRQVGIFLGAEVANRREAGLERLAGIFLGHEHADGRRQRHARLDWPHAGARHRLGPVGDVGVGIDQPRDAVEARQVHDARALRDR